MHSLRHAGAYPQPRSASPTNSMEPACSRRLGCRGVAVSALSERRPTGIRVGQLRPGNLGAMTYHHHHRHQHQHQHQHQPSPGDREVRLWLCNSLVMLVVDYCRGLGHCKCYPPGQGSLSRSVHLDGYRFIRDWGQNQNPSGGDTPPSSQDWLEASTALRRDRHKNGSWLQMTWESSPFGPRSTSSPRAQVP